MKTVSIIGLGYVGLPLACLCSTKGHTTYGIDVDTEKVKAINNKENPIDDDFVSQTLKDINLRATTEGDKELSESDVIIICVPTPVDKRMSPILKFIKIATEKIRNNLKKGQLIILESTVHPGTTEDIVKPILEESGLKDGIDFYLSHCPERIDPGNEQWTIKNIPRVIGSTSEKGKELSKEFYSSILESDILVLSGAKEAEATKIMENSFRDINIAFINEMAKSFDKANIDIMEVIKGASSKPFAFMPHIPGCGVGGHCIPVDPYYLIEKARQIGFDHQFLSLARKINESMPTYTVHILTEELNKIGKALNGSKIGLYGISYKKNIGDIRESPSLKIIKRLKEKGANLHIYDPFSKEENNVNNLNELIEKSDYLIICTNHKEIVDFDINKFKDIKIIIDGRNCLNKNQIKASGIKYKGIGC